MPRRRRYSAPRRGRGYDDYDDYSYYRPRRRHGGCLAPLRRFLRNVAIIVLMAIGTPVFFGLVLLIILNFRIFIQIMIYALYVGAGLAALGLLFLIVRIIVAISQWISAASLARSKARIERERVRIEKERVQQARVHIQMERERVNQARMQLRRGSVQVRAEEARLDREQYAFYQRYQQPAYPTQVTQSPYQTRNLREVESQPLVRALEPPKLPHVTQLIGKQIVANQEDMLYGFELSDMIITAVRGDWPGTAIIAGKSGSGKTRRVIVMLFQAILAQQKITVCDPHAYKPDGLIKVLAPFAPWLTFARTDDEIIAAAKEHIAEFESRLTPSGSVHGEGLTPRLIVFDEFPALMKSDSISKEDKRIIAKCVRESATQYRGFKGFAWIIGQEFTEDAIGDTAIRKDAHAILCHQLSDEYVKFLFPRDLKTQRLIQQIARRECVYKDNDNKTRRISTPTVLDEEIPTMVEYLMRVMPPPRTAQSTTRVATTLHSRQTEPLAPRNYGAPQYRQAAPSQKLVLRRTQLIQQTPSTFPVEPRSSVSRSATWGESAESIPIPSQSPKPTQIAGSLDTEELTPRSIPVLKQSKQPPARPLDPFDALVALRDQHHKKK